MEEKKKSLKWLYWFSLGVAIIAVYKLLDNFGPITAWLAKLLNILMPFIAGLLIAYLFYIPCRKVESWYKKVKPISKRARVLSIITVYIIAVLLIILALNFVIPAISKSIVDLVTNFGNYYNNTMNTINELPEDSVLKSEAVLNAIKGISEIDFKQYINIEKLTEYAKGAINIVNSIFDVFVSFIVSVYLTVSRVLWTLTAAAAFTSERDFSFSPPHPESIRVKARNTVISLPFFNTTTSFTK